MNDQTAASRFESLQQNEPIQNRLTQLRSQLVNLAVRDIQGQLVGEVKDVNLAPNGHINLVVSGQDTARGDRTFLVNSNLIHKIEYATQSVFINLNVAEVERLPDLAMPQTPAVAHSEVPLPPVAPPPRDRAPATFNQSEDLTEEAIRLLEERLVIDRSKQKVGEVVVRKEIETRMVEVPVRREKLIVEQVGDDYKQLAEIDLGQGEINGIDLNQIAGVETGNIVKGEFDSPQKASKFLEAIAAQPDRGFSKVRVELVLDNPLLRETYQEWIERYSGS